jgi:hypothetical protein
MGKLLGGWDKRPGKQSCTSTVRSGHAGRKLRGLQGSSSAIGDWLQARAKCAGPAVLDSVQFLILPPCNQIDVCNE